MGKRNGLEKTTQFVDLRKDRTSGKKILGMMLELPELSQYYHDENDRFSPKQKQHYHMPLHYLIVLH